MRRRKFPAVRDRGSIRRWWIALGLSVGLVISLSASWPTPVQADEYDPSTAGNPLRIVAYVLYPIGFAIDYLIMRPAHWVVSHEPMQTLFGHED